MATIIGNLDIGLVAGFSVGIMSFFRGFRAYRRSRLLQDTPNMATIIGNLDIGLVMGFSIGIVSFFRGFRAYRRSRLLQDTPSTPIRSIAMGFVRIHGKAKSDQLVSSPVTHTPCCYYIVQIHKWEKFKDSGAYFRMRRGGRGVDGCLMERMRTASGSILKTPRGTCLVDPHGAKYELDMTGTREVDSMTASSLATSGVSDRELLAYVARVGRTPQIPGVGSAGA